MAKIAKTEFFEENGIKYQRDIYDTGAIITYPWQDPDTPIPEPEPMPEEEPEPTDTEMIMDAISSIYDAVLELKEEGGE